MVPVQYSFVAALAYNGPFGINLISGRNSGRMSEGAIGAGRTTRIGSMVTAWKKKPKRKRFKLT